MTRARVTRADTSDGDPTEEQPSSSPPPERPSREGSEPYSPVAAFPVDLVSSGEGEEQPVQPGDREAHGAVDIKFSEAGDESPLDEPRALGRTRLKTRIQEQQ